MEETVKKVESAGTPVDVITPDDNEARFAQLEAEKAKAIEEAANWKVAALKAKAKAKEEGTDLDDDEERMEAIAKRTLANSRLAEIAKEQEAIIQRTLKENKELKLAFQNKGGSPPAGMGSHSESTPVRDTLVTPEQMAAFKSRGWSDKDIERYKKNLQRYR